MVRTTRPQREALKRYFERATHDSVQFVKTYRQFRREVQPTFGMDEAIVFPWFGMWVCVEKDGYAHT